MLVSWVGGKSKLAEEIISIFPPHKKYIEPFFGGGWVFFKKKPAEKSIINDINSDLVNLYLVVRDQPQDLARLIWWTPKSREVFNKYIDLYWNKKNEWINTDKVTRAMMYLYLVRNSFNALMRNYSVGSSGWNSDRILETMWAVHEKLKDTTILCDDWKSILDLYANKDTLVYLDPPYMITSEGKDYYYKYIFTKEHHIELRDKLVTDKNKYKWVLSYDIHPLVESLYGGIDGISIIKTSLQHQSSINKNRSIEYDETNKFKSEYLITNFNIEVTLPLFKKGKQDE